MASHAGVAAGKLSGTPEEQTQPQDDEVRLAFDGDAVIFSAESDIIYKENGLDAFLTHETENALNPMKAGPFWKFLHKLARLRELVRSENGTSRVQIALVTARNAPAHERAIQTLRIWGTPADEAHFVGSNLKTPILKAFNAHIFFDDQEKHVSGASSVVAAALVPGPHSPNSPVIPANPAS